MRNTFEVPLGAIGADGADAAVNAAAISRFMLEATKTGTASGNSTLSVAAEAASSSELKRKRDTPSDTSDDANLVPVKQRTVVPELPLTVSCLGRTIIVNTPVDNTIGSVKKLIESQLGESLDEEHLVCGGERLNDDNNLFELIPKNFKIHLAKRIDIVVRTYDDMEYQLKVASSTTIKSVKLAIEKATGIPAVRQRLMYDGSRLCESTTIDEVCETPRCSHAVTYKSLD